MFFASQIIIKIEGGEKTMLKNILFSQSVVHSLKDSLHLPLFFETDEKDENIENINNI